MNPTRGLPQPMRGYLRLPGRLVFIWLLVAAGVIGSGSLLGFGTSDGDAITPAESPPGDAVQRFASTPTAIQGAPRVDTSIRIDGRDGFTVAAHGGELVLAAPGLPELRFASGAEGFALVDTSGRTVYALSAGSDGQARIHGGDGELRARMKCEVEDGFDTCKLYDPKGERIGRVKLKDDGFNIYRAGSERLYKGKWKNGVVQVRDESGARIMTIDGVSSLKAAGLLALPVDVPIRALLWAHAGR